MDKGVYKEGGAGGGVKPSNPLGGVWIPSGKHAIYYMYICT